MCQSVSVSVCPSVPQLMQLFSLVSGWIATKLCICIHSNTVLDEFEGIVDLTPFWVKNLEKIGDFTVDATFLLGFLVDRYQTLYMHSSKHDA